MENMIIISKDEQKRAYIIPYIVDIRQSGKIVSFTLAAPFNTIMPNISYDTIEEANTFFNNCIEKIESYYQAIKPSRFDKLENLDISIGNVNLVKNQTENNIK